MLLLMILTTRLLIAVTQRSNGSSSLAGEDDCGQICSLQFDSQQNGSHYTLLHKHVNCRALMRRMARPATPRAGPPPRRPPPDTVTSFTQNGLCPLAQNLFYRDDSESNSSKPFYFNASSFAQLLEADRAGKITNFYGNSLHRLRPALVRYRRHLQGHVAVVGTEIPWAEAMLLNTGAGRVTTLEHRSLVIEHSQVFTITPPQFARKFLDVNNNNKVVRYFFVTFYSVVELRGGPAPLKDRVAPSKHLV